MIEYHSKIIDMKVVALFKKSTYPTPKILSRWVGLSRLAL
ncbi:hypothetical protein VCRA2123O444_550008 [Vibrio crassostreae]|nr:hypothetical protein VCRA2117O428_520008 [Vibrio crassostreae]CAK2126296.1 hypothetical protein VCRA2113O416_520001 [Vibrio crassostreae]CAK2132160.1 hypothetical protein VCRA2119O430_530001 [Vibrio crassostreae]CAK2133961.1 hypothetical protein VCRA2114O422_560008 [Vibrio crassostreae]CAK2136297.1 hypothetical protein VCRA2119O431_530001 [Vibrio crassostreae]